MLELPERDGRRVEVLRIGPKAHDGARALFLRALGLQLGLELAALQLVDHEPYRGVRLTEAGERVAVEVIRHHRLLELYLAETLGLDVDNVHAEADRLEHVISEELEARIDKALGFPTHDPHGDPIPNAALEWPTKKAG